MMLVSRIHAMQATKSKNWVWEYIFFAGQACICYLNGRDIGIYMCFYLLFFFFLFYQLANFVYRGALIVYYSRYLNTGRKNMGIKRMLKIKKINLELILFCICRKYGKALGARGYLEVRGIFFPSSFDMMIVRIG